MTTLALFQTSTHPNASPQLMSADPQALDLTIYLDITDSVKFAWKAQRDIAERGATMEEVQAAIDARKPDFAAYVEPQKAKADIVVQVIAIVILCNDVRRGRLSTSLCANFHSRFRCSCRTSSTIPPASTSR